MGFLSDWLERRDLRRRASEFVLGLEREPTTADVEWLARHGTDGDVDHAQWELRYARRALGLITARRDALDDRTPSLIARELTQSLASDPNIARDRRQVAERQFNARLRDYAAALERREPVDREPSRARLGRVLLGFAGRSDAIPDAEVGRAGDLLAGYLLEANDSLREVFGAATLPEDVAPSELQRRTG